MGDLPPVVECEGCQDASQLFKRVAAERELVQEKLEAIHKRNTLPLFLLPLWVQNREEEREKLGRVWQGPAEIIDKISDSVYRVNHNGLEQDPSAERLKPFVKLHVGCQPPLHYYAERREIHDNS